MTDIHEYKKPRKSDIYRAEREKGLSYKKIAEKYGVSYQCVAQVCGKQTTNWFRPYTEEEVAYPNLRRWLNENQVSRTQMLRRLGFGGTSCMARVKGWFEGNTRISKHYIDKLIEVTGLSYEELWER